jgi:YD repeat-containing protein
MDNLKIIIHASPQIEWQGRYARHARAGLKKHNIEATITSSPTRVDCDVAMIMGPNAWQRIEQVNKPYIMFNRKFVGNDPKMVHENCAIGWDGFNGRGTFCVDEVDPLRLTRYIDPDKEIEEWRRDGKHFLLCEQSNLGRATNFQSTRHFYNTVVKSTHVPVVFRNKPVGEENIKPEAVRRGLIGAKAAVVLNSTISIEAMMAGVPVISYDVGDPVYPISGHNVNEILYPDRLPLFQYLAHCQWTETEIANGDFWAQLYPKRGPKLHEWSGNG